MQHADIVCNASEGRVIYHQQLERISARLDIVKMYKFTTSQAVEGLASSQLPPSVEQILPARQADFEKLFAYGADMLGTSQTCKLLLAAWLSHLYIGEHLDSY